MGHMNLKGFRKKNGMERGFLEQMGLESNLRGREGLRGPPEPRAEEGIFLAEVGPAGKAHYSAPLIQKFY